MNDTGVAEEDLKMANVFTVAEYILDKLGPMTAMKLQKLVYYSQAWHLTWDEVPLFDEKIEAWANGPVVPALYDAHRGEYRVAAGMFRDRADCELNEDEIESIEQVLEVYGDKDPQWLSNLTHMEDPWKLARTGIKEGARCNEEITKDTIVEYYSSI
ncbi:Panacea domain-containing protein [Vreelandella titanicae]|uniref:Panacea domain-containing protein n=1 Tax=Vreelandella titanicae TaxID=664683 RepID=UPI0039872514|tara:strand:+ start:670 stop:1140 length:471 start_codon:yes stop_codon:yes gene_type:complete